MRKGVLIETNSPKPAATATLHYAAALFDPTHTNNTYRLGKLGVDKKAAVVSHLRALLTDNSHTVESSEESLLSKQQRMAVARNVVLCVLARYSDVVDEVTERWEEEERRQAGERLSKLTAELLTKPLFEETRQIAFDDIESSLYWIVRYFTQ